MCDDLSGKALNRLSLSHNNPAVVGLVMQSIAQYNINFFFSVL